MRRRAMERRSAARTAPQFPGPRGEEAPHELLEALAARVRRCRACGLSMSRRNAVPGDGSGRAGIVLVGEAPGAKEDAVGRPFVGSAGKLLEKLLRRAGLARSDVFITNVVKCRPPGNRPPKPAELDACGDYLESQLRALKPRIVCLMGNSALRALIEPKGNITEMRGRVIERGRRKYLPTYHPAAVLYRRKLIREMERDFELLGEEARRTGRVSQSRLPAGEEE